MTWIQTYTAKEIDPLNLNPRDVCIEDIAHHLSLICRFSGATEFHYSVAQHSIMVARQMRDFPPRLRLLGLLHDAPEYIMNDPVRPVKSSLYFKIGDTYTSFKNVENWNMKIILEGLGLQELIPLWEDKDSQVVIKTFDDSALATERKYLMKPTGSEWHNEMGPFTRVLGIVQQTSTATELAFLRSYRALHSLVTGK